MSPRLFWVCQATSRVGGCDDSVGEDSHGDVHRRKAIWRIDQMAPEGRYTLDNAGRISEMRDRAPSSLIGFGQPRSYNSSRVKLRLPIGFSFAPNCAALDNEIVAALSSARYSMTYFNLPDLPQLLAKPIADANDT